MMRKALGMALMGLVLVVTSANGAIVFQDDFSTGLEKWTVTGETAWDSTGGTMFVGYTTAVAPWYSTAITNATFTESGTYTLTFDTNGNTYDSQPGANWDSAFIVLPGGLQVKYGYWNNGGAIGYKDTLLATGVNVGDSINWRNIKLVADYENLTAELFVNDVSAWSGSLPSAPDFNAYQTITIYAQLTTYFNSYDNVVLNYVPEPLTMSLLAVGSLGLLARRKR